jgi:hypothetical protein
MLAMAKSVRRQHAEQVDRVIGVVRSVLDDRDADLANWADEAVRVDATQAVYALGKLAATLTQQVSAATGQSAGSVLDEARSLTFPSA